MTMADKQGTRGKPTVRMTPDELWQFVRDGHTGILTTLRRDGMPIAMPIWYACLDNRIYIITRGKKLVRIKGDSRAGFLVEDGKHWAELRAVHMTGRAEIVDLDDELSAALREEMARKYGSYRTPAKAMPGTTRQAYAKAARGVVRFTPDERILNWDNSKLPLG